MDTTIIIVLERWRPPRYVLNLLDTLQIHQNITSQPFEPPRYHVACQLVQQWPCQSVGGPLAMNTGWVSCLPQGSHGLHRDSGANVPRPSPLGDFQKHKINHHICSNWLKIGGYLKFFARFLFIFPFSIFIFDLLRLWSLLRPKPHMLDA